MKLSLPYLFVMISVFTGCAAPNSTSIIDASELVVKDCEFVQYVYGNSLLKQTIGITRAQNDAREKAQELDATHIVWKQTNVNWDSSSASGDAYKCK